MRATLLSLGILSVWSLPASAVTFDTTSIVGAATNSNGTEGACVVVSSTKIRCGYYAAGSWTWCNEYTVNINNVNLSTYSGHTGIYLVQNFQASPHQHAYAFLPVYDSFNVYWGVERYRLDWDVASTPTCVYHEDFHYFPYITGQTHPDVGRHLGVADGSGSADDAYVFTIVPSSDSYASGSLLGAKWAGQGQGAVTDFYSTGHYGITGARDFDSTDGGPIAAVKSSLSSLPLVVGPENGAANTYYGVYEDTASTWHRITASGHVAGVGKHWVSLAIVPVPSQSVGATSYGDSIFGVGSDGFLYEEKFKHSTGYGFGLFSSIGENGGNPLDTVTDSLAASYYYPSPTSPPRAIAYARRDASNGDAASTDIVNGGATVWSNFCSNIPANTNYDGVQTNIASSGGPDTVFSACDDGNGGTTLCAFARSWGTTTQTWSQY